MAWVVAWFRERELVVVVLLGSYGTRRHKTFG